MHVSVEKTSELNRKITVRIPPETIQQKMEPKFQTLARQAKLAGFRQGKVPLSVVKKMFAEQVRNEVWRELLESSYKEALTANKELRPASEPQVNFADKPETEGLEYYIEFEVYPEISLDGVAQLEIKQLVSSVTEDDIDKMIEKLRQQRKVFNEVERPAQQGDRVTIHFSGVSEDENFTDGKTENFQLEIGADRMIPGFEDELIGLSVGDSKTFNVTFPTPYHNDKLSGKTAEFSVEMVKIEEGQVPDVDAEFIQTFGVDDGDMESFRADVRLNMERQLTNSLKDELKNATFAALYENISLSLPHSLIEQEIENLRAPYIEQAQRNDTDFAPLDLSNDDLEERAKRRIALALILGEVIQQNNIALDHSIVRNAIENMASNYEKPEEVVQWYYAEKDRLHEIQQMVLEGQAIDWVLGHAKVIEEIVGFNDVLKLNDND